MTELRRLIIAFSPEGLQLRALYKRKDGPKPGTVGRRREVEQLARSGLTAALEALGAGGVADLGTSGYSVREDVLGLPVASRDAVNSQNTMKGGHHVKAAENDGT